jgi:hypothetical protein
MPRKPVAWRDGLRLCRLPAPAHTGRIHKPGQKRTTLGLRKKVSSVTAPRGAFFSAGRYEENESGRPIALHVGDCLDILVSISTRGCQKMPHVRYHVRINQKRTTITMDITLSRLLAASLATDGVMAGHSSVRAWLDNALSTWAAFDSLLPVSRQATHLALLQVARPELVELASRPKTQLLP